MPIIVNTPLIFDDLIFYFFLKVGISRGQSQECVLTGQKLDVVIDEKCIVENREPCCDWRRVEVIKYTFLLDFFI